MVGASDEEIEEKFGFLLQALSYGAPPHGGIALGFDRLMMFLLKTDSIRDVVAFQNQRASCLMTEAPSEVPSSALKNYIYGFDSYLNLNNKVQFGSVWSVFSNCAAGR